VRVTLSEDARGLLLIAEVASRDNRRVVMLRWRPPAPAESTPRITLTQKLLLTQPEPILDILLVDSDAEMLVLNQNRVASYRRMPGSTDGKWIPGATASLLLSRPMPRDPRGRLETSSGGVQAFLPVGTCLGAWNPELKLTCDNVTANWPGTSETHWVADRNVLESDAPAPGFEGWGSDWASIANPCGSGSVEIASSPNSEQDSVRAYQVVNRQAAPMSDAMPVPGPVTALWPAESGKDVTLVVHNLQTGEYEASRLGLACAQ